MRSPVVQPESCAETVFALSESLLGPAEEGEEMSGKYRVVITETLEPVAAGSEEVLSFRVSLLHEIAPLLAALYPPPVVKRQHQRKVEVTL